VAERSEKDVNHGKKKEVCKQQETKRKAPKEIKPRDRPRFLRGMCQEEIDAKGGSGAGKGGSIKETGPEKKKISAPS